MSSQQLDALRRFIDRNGRYWKQALRDLWESDVVAPDAGLLRQLRNEFGPSWLVKVKLKEILS